MLLVNGFLHPVDAPDIPQGWLSFAGSIITGLGPMENAPQTEGPVLDLAGAHLCPGFLDAHCHLGLFGDGLGFEADDANEATDPVTPHLRALDGVNPLDRTFAEARAAGVTAALVSPGSANPIGGQAVLLKTNGRWVDEMVLAAPAAMKFALGENPKTAYNERKEGPVTRMATAALIRETLKKAAEYQTKRQMAEADPDGEAPEFDAKLEALLPVLERKVPAHFHAHRADDIATALRIGREFGLRAVIVHATEGHLVAPLLEQEQVPVITGPCLTDRSKPELAGACQENPVLLSRHTPTAICTDHPETPIQYLPLCAAMAVRAGMAAADALAAAALVPAQILGVDAQLGSLTVGKDADLVVTAGHPLDWQSRAQRVFLGGVQVDQPPV